MTHSFPTRPPSDLLRPRHVGGREAFLNRCGFGRVFFTAEQVMERHDLPVARCRVEGAWHAGEPAQAIALAFDQASTRVTGTQVTADFVLELVPGLWRVPARRPGERHLGTRFGRTRAAFHGERESGVVILGGA